MERKSTRIQNQGQSSAMSKKRSNKKEEIIISGSDSEATQSLHEASPPAKKIRTEKGDEGSSAVKQKKIADLDDDQPIAELKKKGEAKKKGEDKKKKEKAVDREPEENVTEKASGKEEEKGGEAEPTAQSKPEAKKPRMKTIASASKKAYQGKSVLPSHWYINSDVRKVWMGGFSFAKVAYCNLVSEALLEKLDFDYLRMFKQTALMKLLNPSSKAYPRLTRLFYLNLVQEDDFVLTTRVAGVDMRLDHRTFAKALGIPKRFDTRDHPDKKECLDKAKAMFFLEGTPTGPKQLTHSVLNCEAKILFTILMRSVVPKENSRELVTDRVLILMYLIVQGFEVDACNVVMEHMLYCASRSRNHPLPYANLLPLFFEYFEIPLKGEEKVTSGFGMIDETALQRLGIAQTEKGSWDFSKTKEASTSKDQGTTDHAQLLDKLEGQEIELEDLRTRLYDLSSDFHQFKALMGAMNEKLDVVIKGLHLEKIPSATSHDTSADSDMELNEYLKKKNKKPIPVVLSEDLFEPTDDEAAEKNTGVDAATEGNLAKDKGKKVDEGPEEVTVEAKAGVSVGKSSKKSSSA